MFCPLKNTFYFYESFQSREHHNVTDGGEAMRYLFSIADIPPKSSYKEKSRMSIY